MIATVVPCERLPKEHAIFDYAIPAGIQIGRGDLVEAPFRQKTIRGVVVGLAKTSRFSTKPIMRVITPHWLDERDLQRYEHIAAEGKGSLSTIFATILPPVVLRDRAPSEEAPRTAEPIVLKTHEANAISNILANPRGEIAASPEVACAVTAKLMQEKKHRVLVLVPEERLLDLYANLLPGVTVFKRSLAKTERSRLMRRYHQGEIHTLLTTARDVLLPTHQRLTHVIALHAAHEEYHIRRQEPRFDALHAARALASAHGAAFLAIDTLPRLTPSLPLTTLPDTIDAEVVNPYAPHVRGKHEFLSDPIVETTKNALQQGKNVLWFFNRKGVAKTLQCRDCGHFPTCGACGALPTVREDDLHCGACGAEMWIPKTCPSCQSPRLAWRGLGLQKIASGAKQLFPDTPLLILQKEGGETLTTEPTIILATEAFWSQLWQPFRNLSLGLVADLFMDIGLLSGDTRGTEATLRRILDRSHLARRHKALLILEATNTDLILPLLSPHTAIQRELALRKQYNPSL